MKAIIEGKRYDTDKATKLGEGGSDGATSRTDFRWYKEALYRTPRSRVYFLAGRGGPMTRYARPAGQNAWQGGERIIPLTAAQARQWAEQNLTADQVEAIFADQITDA